MSTIKTNAILDASGGNTTTINGTTPTAYNTMGKNLIINGDMRIAQRATSVSSITAFGYFALDRWREDHYNSGTWTQSQDTDVPTGQGFSNSLKMQCTTAQSPLAVDARLSQTYRIEGQDLQYLRYGSSNAESVTLSFWIKTNKTGTYVITLLDIDNGKLINSQYTVSSANTWEKKTLTFSGNTLNNYDNDNNPSLQIEMWFGAGTNFTTGSIQSSWTTSVATDRAAGLTVNLADNTANYLNITGVQLEVGSVATEFERRPYGTELALCQRYCYVIDASNSSYATAGNAIAFSTNYAIANTTLPVSMRTKYTSLTISNNAHWLISDYNNDYTWSNFVLNSSNSTPNLVIYEGTTATTLTAGRTYVARAANNTSAKLTFSAEL